MLGQVEVSRALGDQLMKEYIINTPFSSSKVVAEGDSHVIIGCDGVVSTNCSDLGRAL